MTWELYRPAVKLLNAIIIGFWIELQYNSDDVQLNVYNFENSLWENLLHKSLFNIKLHVQNKIQNIRMLQYKNHYI